jgi:hypothetical protein
MLKLFPKDPPIFREQHKQAATTDALPAQIIIALVPHLAALPSRTVMAAALRRAAHYSGPRVGSTRGVMTFDDLLYIG